MLAFTIYLYIYESRCNDFILAVNFVIRKTLLIEEQLLRVQNLALTNPQVFTTNTKISFQNHCRKCADFIWSQLQLLMF